MPNVKFRYIPEIATADIGFEAFGKNLSQLFQNAGFAVEEAMVDIKDVKPKISKKIKLDNEELEKLLFDFLNELVYIKDADLLLFSKIKCTVKESKSKFSLTAEMKGEKIDTKRHDLKNDIKAVTWHMFEVKKEKSAYKALVIVDV